MWLCSLHYLNLCYVVRKQPVIGPAVSVGINRHPITVSSIIYFLLSIICTMKSIPTSVRDEIVSLATQGQSTREIAAKLNLSHMTVSRIREIHLPFTPKPAAGRPVCLTSSQKRLAVRYITTGQAKTAQKAAALLHQATNKAVSGETIRRVLKAAGLKAKKKQKKPRLLPQHRQQRMDFARKYQHWTTEDWRRVVWSDETKINRIGSDGVKWAWTRPNQPLVDTAVEPTVKFGGGSLMLWGCMTSRGIGEACKIEGSMDAALYTEILNDHLLGTLRTQRLKSGGNRGIIFQQDNDPKHTSRLAQKWFQDHHIEVLDWPAQSADLNPIEHLWTHLKHRVADYAEQPNSIAELWDRVQVQWHKIPVATCLNLIDSMPRRIAAVLKAKGGNTKY